MRGAAVGTINKYKEVKMPDGSWKYIGSKGVEHPVVKELIEKGLLVSEQKKKPISQSSEVYEEGVRTVWSDTSKYSEVLAFPRGSKVIGIVNGETIEGIVEKYAERRIGVRVSGRERVPVRVDNISIKV